MDTKLVEKYIQEKLIMVSWGDYEGIKKLTKEDLLILRAFINDALSGDK